MVAYLGQDQSVVGNGTADDKGYGKAHVCKDKGISDQKEILIRV